MSRKITVILGSPRRDGNSERLAAALVRGASEVGYKAQYVRMHGLKVGGCIDCRRCWSNGTHCFLNDDMKEVYAALDTSDVIVFASPLYFYSWAAQIKPIWDRLLPYFHPNSKVDVRGRVAVLLSTAGDKDAKCFGGLKKSFELACAYCGWRIAGEILAHGVYGAGEISEKGDWLKRAEDLGKKLQTDEGEK
ncbi:MAG: flavodoxin family protein [Synergistaceae bacterium]|jgi:multimeric flavodoxin WrbA|nr:flavodoxin family protein [Synergistaceae bacterium]